MSNQSLTDRVLQNFPRIANQIQKRGISSGTQALLDECHYYDLLILDYELISEYPQYLGPSGLIRQRHDDVISLFYFSPADIPDLTPGIGTLHSGYLTGISGSWYMKTSSGTNVNLFQNGSSYTKLANLTTPIRDYIPNYIYNNIWGSGAYFDGIYYDWASISMSFLVNRNGNGSIDWDNNGSADTALAIDTAWISGVKQLYTNTLNKFPSGTPIVGNAGWNTGLDYLPYLNGVNMEQFLEGQPTSPSYYSWAPVMKTYSSYIASGVSPRLGVVMVNNDDEENYTLMRFGLCSALMADGYFCYTNRTVPDVAYQTNRWYDEYTVSPCEHRAVKSLDYKGWMGRAKGPAYNAHNPNELFLNTISSGGVAGNNKLWRRDFDNATAFCNPSTSGIHVQLERVFYKIRGIYDTAFNDGSQVTSITVPASGGVVLVNNGGSRYITLKSSKIICQNPYNQVNTTLSFTNIKKGKSTTVPIDEVRTTKYNRSIRLEDASAISGSQSVDNIGSQRGVYMSYMSNGVLPDSKIL